MPGTCAVEGCEQSRRKRNWCASHYNQWRLTGEVKPFQWKWGRRTTCSVCGTAIGGQGSTCSPKCAAQQVNHRRIRPAEKACERCGAMFSTIARTKQGHLKRIDTRMCPACRRAKSQRHKVSTSVLLQRDGDHCRICWTRVDMTLRFPDPMSASVDHRIPFARGGTHDPENLQLAHLRCNHIKSDRLTLG